jgi:hypothetical protein
LDTLLAFNPVARTTAATVLPGFSPRYFKTVSVFVGAVAGLVGLDM